MSYEVLVVLFLLLSVISSVINKIRESRAKQDQAENRPYVPMSRRPVPEPDEEEIDLSEWDVLQELERHRGSSAGGEFREIRGARPVSEEDTGPEFREVVSTRDVEEPAGGVEFQEVRGTRQVIEESPYATHKETSQSPPQEPRAESPPPATTARRRKRSRLRLNPRSLRQAILFNEILGPPRADHMPW